MGFEKHKFDHAGSFLEISSGDLATVYTFILFDERTKQMPAGIHCMTDGLPMVRIPPESLSSGSHTCTPEHTALVTFLHDPAGKRVYGLFFSSPGKTIFSVKDMEKGPGTGTLL
jgi:hypothetical protein